MLLHERLCEEVKKIVRDWDPVHLIAGHGCPEDEYDSEAEMIALSHYRCKNVAETRNMIREVMDNQFGKIVLEQDGLEKVTRDVWKLFQEESLVD